MAAFGAAAVTLAIAGALFDALEDVFLLRALEGKDGDLAPHLGAIFAGLKFAALSGGAGLHPLRAGAALQGLSRPAS